MSSVKSAPLHYILVHYISSSSEHGRANPVIAISISCGVLDSRHAGASIDKQSKGEQGELSKWHRQDRELQMLFNGDQYIWRCGGLLLLFAYIRLAKLRVKRKMSDFQDCRQRLRL